MRRYRFTKKRRAALNKARRKWVRMSPRERRKVMPSRNPNPKRRYKVGQVITIDVGRPKHHYLHAKKTKYGWIAGPLRKYKKRWEEREETEDREQKEKGEQGIKGYILIHPCHQEEQVEEGRIIL